METMKVKNMEFRSVEEERWAGQNVWTCRVNGNYYVDIVQAKYGNEYSARMVKYVGNAIDGIMLSSGLKDSPETAVEELLDKLEDRARTGLLLVGSMVSLLHGTIEVG